MMGLTNLLFQSHQGIFQLLPLGLRVQQKIEDLLDKHMRSIGSFKTLRYQTQLTFHEVLLDLLFQQSHPKVFGRKATD